MLRQSSGVIGMRATVPICASLDLDFAVSALKYLHLVCIAVKRMWRAANNLLQPITLGANRSVICAKMPGLRGCQVRKVPTADIARAVRPGAMPN
jgi:hypothetical protein